MENNIGWLKMIKANNTDTGIELLYRGKPIDNILFEEEIVNEYNELAGELDLTNLPVTKEWDTGFLLPASYLSLNVEERIWSTFAEYSDNIPEEHHRRYIDRIQTELGMFKARNLFPLLQLMIYIVESLQETRTVYGVGRGSSVASYCLFLLGVHKVDSVKYELDITEFLK